MRPFGAQAWVLHLGAEPVPAAVLLMAVLGEASAVVGPPLSFPPWLPRSLARLVYVAWSAPWRRRVGFMCVPRCARRGWG